MNCHPAKFKGTAEHKILKPNDCPESRTHSEQKIILDPFVSNGRTNPNRLTGNGMVSEECTLNDHLDLVVESREIKV